MYQIRSLSVHPLRSYEWWCKMQKIGWFGVVRGHWRSWTMPPFDRAHTTFYSTLIETMCLIFYRFRDIAGYLSKVADFHHPTCIRRPRREWPRWNFAEIFGTRKLDSMGVSCGVVCVILRFAVLVEHQLVTDRHRHRQTDTDTGLWLVLCLSTREKIIRTASFVMTLSHSRYHVT